MIGADQVLALGDDDLLQARQHGGGAPPAARSPRQDPHAPHRRRARDDGKTIWAETTIATLTMRKLSPAFLGRYLAAAGDEVLSSVGAYQLEGLGIQLFEKIEGDYFTILGLPLLPLLERSGARASSKAEPCGALASSAGRSSIPARR